MKTIRQLVVLVCSVFAFLSKAFAASANFYDLTIPLENQLGKAVHWKDLRGGYTVVSMFYTSCDYSCPLIFSQLKDLDTKLKAQKKQPAHYLLVTFDPDKDTVDKLKSTAKRFDVDDTRWQLVRTKEENVRRLSVLLGVKYKKLDNGHFAHSNSVILIDPTGKLVAQTEDLTSLESAFASHLK